MRKYLVFLMIVILLGSCSNSYIKEVSAKYEAFVDENNLYLADRAKQPDPDAVKRMIKRIDVLWKLAEGIIVLKPPSKFKEAHDYLARGLEEFQEAMMLTKSFLVDHNIQANAEASVRFKKSEMLVDQAREMFGELIDEVPVK